MELKIRNLDEYAQDYEIFNIEKIIEKISDKTKKYMICNYDSHGLFQIYELNENAENFDFENYHEFTPDILISDDRKYFADTPYGKIKYLNCLKVKKPNFDKNLIILFESSVVILDNKQINLDE